MVSVLIVNWNTKDHLNRCLTALCQPQNYLDLQIIVVDNNSQDGSAELVQEKFSQVTLIKSPTNLGYAEGNNLAFQSSTQPFILTLNPDTEVSPETIYKSLLTLQARPQCASLSLRFIGPDGETQKSIREFPTLKNIFGDLLGLGKSAPESDWGNYRMANFNYQKSQICPQPMATYLLFSRQSLNISKITDQLFDPLFPIFFNEVDLLKKLKDSGFECWYESGLSIYHHHGASTKQVKKSMIWESHKSLVRYFAKHLKGIQRVFLPLIAVASYSAAFLRAKGFHAGFRTEHNNL